MLNPARSLARNSDAGRPMPKVDGLEALYRLKCTPRHGEVIMIAGRSGAQKSGFTMWWVDEMNLDTLYLSGDMSAFTASSRIASKRSGYTTEEVESIMTHGDGVERDFLMECLADSRITFSFGSPITFRQIDQELDAYVELWDKYPEVIVVDNLCDVDGCETEYAEQMSAMANLTEMARATGATVIVLHHCSDKTWEAKTDPWQPPSRDQVKNGLAEKPELTLTVALDPNTMDYRVAVVKQRMGPCDPTARHYAILRCEPELTRFHRAGPRII